MDSVAQVILRREITCYGDAQRLLQAQEDLALVEQQQWQRRHTVNIPEERTLLQHKLPQLIRNAREAEWFSSQAQAHFLRNIRRSPQGHSCPVHPLHFLPHEHERVIYCWYFIKLYILSYESPLLRQDCNLVPRHMCVTEAYVIWVIINWLSEMLGDGEQEKLGIRDDNPPDPLLGIRQSIQAPEWAAARERMTDFYVEYVKKHRGHYGKVEEWLNGPCDICTGNGCKERDPSKGMWEL